MRRPFADIFLEHLRHERLGRKFVLITADMGYGLWDNVRKEFPDQFINVGSAEQLMIGMAAGYAMEGFTPVCYSITPFLLYRPFEFIRNFMNHEQLGIKLVGGGRNKDYGYLGFTHWAEEDLDVMRQLKNIRTFKPDSVDTMSQMMVDFLYSDDPCYMNLVK